jgi:hypothetical protein
MSGPIGIACRTGSRFQARVNARWAGAGAISKRDQVVCMDSDYCGLGKQIRCRFRHGERPDGPNRLKKIKATHKKV